MKTFIFKVGKLWIAVSSDTDENAIILAKNVAQNRLGDKFDGKFDAIVELAAHNTATVWAA